MSYDDMRSFTPAELMPCSNTSAGDEPDKPLDDTDVEQAITIAAFGMDAIDIDYYVSDDKITIQSVRVEGVELFPMIDCLHATYPVYWAGKDRMISAIERIEMLVREQLEREP